MVPDQMTFLAVETEAGRVYFDPRRVVGIFPGYNRQTRILLEASEMEDIYTTEDVEQLTRRIVAALALWPSDKWLTA